MSQGDSDLNPHWRGRGVGSSDSNPHGRGRVGSSDSNPHGRGRGVGSGDSNPHWRGRGVGSVDSNPHWRGRGVGSVDSNPHWRGRGVGSVDSNPHWRGRGVGSGDSNRGLGVGSGDWRGRGVGSGDSNRHWRGRGGGGIGSSGSQTTLGNYSSACSSSSSQKSSGRRHNAPYSKEDLVESWLTNTAIGSVSSSSNVSGGGNSSGRECRKVKLSNSIEKCYKEAENLEMSLDWVKSDSVVGVVGIEEAVREAKKKGFFAKTDFEYSVFLLGSMHLSTRGEGIETLVHELYNDGNFTVMHGVFSRIKRGRKVVSDDDENREKIAKDLADLFTKRPDIRLRIRKQWLEWKADGLPHDGCKYSCERLVDECKFFISEYLKHAPYLGLTVEEYIDFTSTLYEHCHPNFGKIDETANFAFITPKNSLSKLNLDHKFTKDTLTENLLSLPKPNPKPDEETLTAKDQQFPYNAISKCNKLHNLCILSEVRYIFRWVKGELFSYKPTAVNFRTDYCENRQSNHSYSYLSQKDRISIINAIKNDSSYGFDYGFDWTKEKLNQPDEENW